MTEKRRLATAAAAIKMRMMTLSRVLVFFALPPERASRGWADIVATGGTEAVALKVKIAYCSLPRPSVSGT